MAELDEQGLLDTLTLEMLENLAPLPGTRIATATLADMDFRGVFDYFGELAWD